MGAVHYITRYFCVRVLSDESSVEGLPKMRPGSGTQQLQWCQPHSGGPPGFPEGRQRRESASCVVCVCVCVCVHMCVCFAHVCVFGLVMKLYPSHAQMRTYVCLYVFYCGPGTCPIAIGISV